MFEMVPLLVALITFACVAGIVFVVGRYVNTQALIQQRLHVPVSTSQSAGSTSQSGGLSEVAPSYFMSSLTGKIDEKRFGIEGALRSKLRRDLIRAGYFSDEAIRYYIFARLGLVLVLPTIAFIFAWTFGAGQYLTLLIVGISVLLAIAGVDAYIAQRQRALRQEYRLVFPDLVDMLVVCIDAGLGLDAAFARMRPEVAKQSHALGMNLVFLSAETRAGRSTADALAAFAERLNLDEARSFVMMLRQSLELGTDMNDALRVFSDEMRQKRLLRAEENANKLPVKMTLPLGTCIFPVILMVILVPVIIKLIMVTQIVK
jgi:tight adherence protein C